MPELSRSSGVLMPISSLPSPCGIGTFGKVAYEFVDFLKASGQKFWQILPIGPTGYGDSPYSSFSTRAGNPYFIDPEILLEQGLVTENDLSSPDWGSCAETADYGMLYRSRPVLLKKAFESGKKKLAARLDGFRSENPWVEDYSLFMALKAHFGMKGWSDWPDDGIRLCRRDSVEKYRHLLAKETDFYSFTQMLFFDQWRSLKNYANENGILILGDIPIYTALDSVEVWAEPDQFLLDADRRPTFVAGVPPDAFTADGQLWGNPIYDWSGMKSDGYAWWKERLESTVRLYDAVRFDHFRGLDSYWAIPAGDSTAVNGRWLPGPGKDLVKIMKEDFPETIFIAEDLGYLTDSVAELVKYSGFPGMKILEFAFDGHGDSIYLPEKCTENSVCYLGTHDNDTVLGWLSGLSKADREYAADYMNIKAEEGWNWGMIRTGMNTRSKLFIVQMQDILELDGKARMNYPSKSKGYWRWRMKPGAATEKISEKLLAYTVSAGRYP